MQKTLKVIVEGIDNCGKSTQITNIVKHFKLPILKLHYYGCPIKNDNEASIEFETILYREMFNVLKSYDYVICDRSHLGNMVYAPKYRGYSGDFVLDIEDEYPYNDLCLITFIDEPENVIARDDGLSFSINLEDKKEEIAAFVRAHKMSKIEHKLLVNINNMTIEEVTEKVIEFLEQR